VGVLVTEYQSDNNNVVCVLDDLASRFLIPAYFVNCIQYAFIIFTLCFKTVIRLLVFRITTT